MKVKKSTPIIYDYRDLSEYLREVYKFRKHQESSFSYEKWADEMGLKSRSYLRMIVTGQKSPATNLLPSLLKGLILNPEETSYFVSLFNHQSAPTPEIKAIYTKEIFRAWTRRIQETEVANLAEFLADPVIAHLFTYLSFDDSPSDISQWSRDLNATPERINQALRCLIWQKLVDGKIQDDGQIIYRTSSPIFTIPSGAASDHVRQFHIEGIKQAHASFDQPKENRKMWSAFVALSGDQHARATDLINDFNKRLVAIFSESTIHGKKLYRINQQMLAVSQKVDTQK
jgi:uncharacterized protein (TIGR02147 family)